MMLGTHRPKPVHVRIDNGQVVKHTYEVMPKVPLEKWKSRGAGVVHTPYRGMTTRHIAIAGSNWNVSPAKRPLCLCRGRFSYRQRGEALGGRSRSIPLVVRQIALDPARLVIGYLYIY
jgi:hypothetical protein